MALLYFRWRSSDHFRLDGRVIYCGSSDHVGDGSIDHRVALFGFGWRSSYHFRFDCRVIHRGSTDP